MQPLDVDEPTAVGPYRLLGRLGSGGMGRVYLGRSAGGRTVAVKIVHPHFALDEEFRARFRREVDAARRVGGAWTAPVLDADPEAAVPWVATAYAAGPSLAAAVADAGPLPAHSVRVLGAGLAEALAAVHGLGLVHRDVKPSNVLLTLDGPLLIDFGIARATDGTASLTSTGVSVGSPGYMAPEQILGRGITGAADVFSLGAVLAYAATGAPPFRGDSSAALLYQVVHEEPELGTLDGDLRRLAEACLAKEPETRPAPADVTRRLAPEGTARLVAGGWLPGRLVEQVSRSAVRLLNLEAAGAEQGAQSGAESESGAGLGRGSAAGAGAGAGAVPDSGPVEFSRASVTDPGSVQAPSSPSVPSVPSAPSTSSAPATAAPGVRPLSVPGPRDVSPRDTAAPGTVPGGATAPNDPVPSGAQGPGRFSVTVAAGAVPGSGGRGRRLSCSVVLAVAGALAVVTVGSVFLFRPDGRDGKDSAGGSGSGAYSSAPGTASGRSPGASASASPGKSPGKSPGASPGASSSPTPGVSDVPGPTAVPDRYLGTWEGQGTALDGALPIGTFRLTVHRARVGEELGTLRQTDQLGGVCDDVLTLRRVTRTQLVVTSVGAPANHAGCDPAPHTVRLTPAGDDLQYTADSSPEGNPRARLSKVR